MSIIITHFEKLYVVVSIHHPCKATVEQSKDAVRHLQYGHQGEITDMCLRGERYREDHMKVWLRPKEHLMGV